MYSVNFFNHSYDITDELCVLCCDQLCLLCCDQYNFEDVCLGDVLCQGITDNRVFKLAKLGILRNWSG